MKIRQYNLGETQITYFITEEGRTSLFLLPNDQKEKLAANWELSSQKVEAGAEHNREWNPGSLVQLHLRHHKRSLGSGVTMKYSESTDQLCFEKQWEEKEADRSRIITVLASKEQYKVVHTLIWEKGQTALFCETELVNESNSDVEVEMLTSFCLENLSPCQKDSDQAGKISFHRFRGSWALEGMHLNQSIEELGLEKAWCSPFPKSEKFGSVGSWTTESYFPTAAVEDREHHILWAAALEINASWQMELSRDGDTFSFSGGIADAEKGAWTKTVKPGEHFCAPRAYISVINGDIYDACESLTRLENIAADAYGEKGMPIVFNEYCSSWGNPTQEKMLQFARILKGKGIRYLVIDAGWSMGSKEQLGNGEWLVDTNRFPDMKGMNRALREDGFIPGIWFEFEVTTEGAKVYEKEFDRLHLKRNGVVIHTGPSRTFWDFTNPEVIEYLSEHVIDMLKEYDFGYLKVDYNGNIGMGCDGAESLGEGLRKQMQGVRDFFVKIKSEIPDIVIENCASGANRTEPSMMAVTAMTSFSDAHEGREIPYIAGNLQNLMLPRQNQIWAVLRKEDTRERLEYGVAAGFLGRLCLSGDIEQLSEEQWEIVSHGIRFYKGLESILKNGTFKIFGKRSNHIRHPKGTQAVVRLNANEMLVVCHGFEETAEEFVIPMEEGFCPSAYYGKDIFCVERNQIVVKKMQDWTAGAVYLVKKQL